MKEGVPRRLGKIFLWLMGGATILATILLVAFLYVIRDFWAIGWTNYYHVSFEDTLGAEVLSHGEPEYSLGMDVLRYGKMYRSGVWSVKSMPTKYVLRRDEYTVYIELDMADDVFLAGFYLRATTPEGGSLRMRVLNSSICGGRGLSRLHGRSPGVYYACRSDVLRGGPTAIEPVPPCRTLSESSCAVRFVIRDDRVLGEESLPFTVKANGKFIYFYFPIL